MNIYLFINYDCQITITETKSIYFDEMRLNLKQKQLVFINHEDQQVFKFHVQMDLTQIENYIKKHQNNFNCMKMNLRWFNKFIVKMYQITVILLYLNGSTLPHFFVM